MHGRYAISKYVVAEMEQDNLLTTTLVTTQINLVDGGIVHWPYSCVGCIVYFFFKYNITPQETGKSTTTSLIYNGPN
jgi:hypothetical protein